MMRRCRHILARACLGAVDALRKTHQDWPGRLGPVRHNVQLRRHLRVCAAALDCGDASVDSFRWLQEDPAALQRNLLQWSKRAARWQASLEPMLSRLEEEILEVQPDTTEGQPQQIGSISYFVRCTADAPFPRFVRRCSGSEQVILDQNDMPQYTIGQVKLSKCQNYLAYTLSSGASEAFEAVVKHIETGQILDKVQGVVSIEWAATSCHLLYTMPDSLGRPHQVYLHRIAAKQMSDTCLLEESCESAFLELTMTKDWQYVLLNSNTKTSSQVHAVDANNPTAWPHRLQERASGLLYFAEHNAGHVYLITSPSPTHNYALARAPVASDSCREWDTIVPERLGVAVEDMAMFETCCVLYERHDGQPAISVVPVWVGGWPQVPTPVAPAALHTIRLPADGTCTSLTPGANPDFCATALTFTTASPIAPDTHHALDLAELTALARARPSGATPLEALGSATTHIARPGSAVNFPELVCYMDHACGHDGMPIPVTLAHHAALRKDGRAPALLGVYGAYGLCLESGFQPERLSLLRRGWVLALAHVRGGGELGRPWHAGGAGENKANTALDLEACLDHLVATGLSAPGRVALHAVSAGGAAAGAVLNRRGAELGAAVLHAPFVDLVSAMTDPSLALTVHEYEEWGDPRDPDALRRMQALCPYLNLRPGVYPPVLVTIGEADVRVPPWGPAKWAARLQVCQQGPGPIMLVPRLGQGHFADERMAVRDGAVEVAFLLDAVRS